MSNPPTGTSPATFVEPREGFREEIQFLGQGKERIFSIFHAPLGPVRGAVLICSSILAEHLSGYQEEVWLSRRLAREGLAVRRFHYRGSGHSDGEADEMTYEDICGDAAFVAEHLRAETGIERLGFVGSRVGALVAARLSAKMDGLPVALIQPILDGARLFREVSRARHIWHMNEEGRGEGVPAPEDMVAVMKRDGWVDVLGHPLTLRLHSDLMDVSLEDELGMRPHPVHLVQVAKRKGLAAEYQQLMNRLDEKGFPTRATAVNDDIAWWFHDSRRHLIPEIGDAIVPWLSRLTAAEATI